MVDKERNTCNQSLCYILEQWEKMGSFDIMNNISGHVKLVLLMYSLGNANNSASVVGKWIFNYNYKNTYHY